MHYPVISLPSTKAHDPFQLHSRLADPDLCPFPTSASMPHGGPWRSASVVSFPPGYHGRKACAPTVDALFFTLAGRGRLVSDGDACPLEAGVMASVPAGTAQALVNTSASEALVLFLAEVAVPTGAPSYPPSFCHLVQELHASDHFHPVVKGTQRIRPRMAQVDLRHALAAPWGTLSLVEIPPGCHVDPYIEAEQDQVLVVMRGKVAFTIPKGSSTATEPEKLEETRQVERDGRCHHRLFVPRGMSCGWRNEASREVPLFMACLTVLRPNRCCF